jgi:hypothetical protein
MSGLSKRIWVLAVLCGVFAVLLGAQRAEAEAPVANWANSMSRQAAKEKATFKLISDALTYGRREERPIGEDAEGMHWAFSEWVVAWDGAGAWFYRSGFETVDSGFLGLGAKTTRLTSYWQGLDKLGEVKSVIKNGIETIVDVDEWVPGSIDLKPGDSRPAQPSTTSAAGKRPVTFDPKADGSLGRASGAQYPSELAVTLAGSAQDSADGDDSKPEKPSTNDGDDGSSGSSPGGDTGGGSRSVEEEHPDWQISGSASYLSSDGTMTSVQHYDTPDGGSAWVTTTTDSDGNSTRSEQCFNDGEEVDCNSGMTVEATCRSDCERLAFLADLFAQCEAGTCGDVPIDTEHSEQPQPCGRLAYVSNAPVSRDLNDPPCTIGRVSRSGAPEDYGNGADPNGTEAPAGIDPRDDGVTDPAEPGAAEMALGPGESIGWDMRGTLRDPAVPPGSEEEVPGPDRPTPGDAE